MTSLFANSEAQGVRPKGRAGVLGPREAPQGPRAACAGFIGAESSMGGWVAPLGDSLEWGAPRKGGSKGGNQGGGRAARPCALSRPTFQFLPGRAGVERALKPAAVTISERCVDEAGRRVARLEDTRAAKRRRSSRRASPASQATRSPRRRPSPPTGPTACSCTTSQFLGCKPAGRCPCITCAEEMEPLDSCATDAPATRRRAAGGRGSTGGTDCPRG